MIRGKQQHLGIFCEWESGHDKDAAAVADAGIEDQKWRVQIMMMMMMMMMMTRMRMMVRRRKRILTLVQKTDCLLVTMRKDVGW